MDTKKIVVRLRVEGLSIEAAAAKWVLQWLDRQPDAAEAFEVVIRHLPKASLTSNVLNTEILNTTINGLSHNIDGEVAKHSLVVIPSTSFPHHRYNFTRNTFLPADDSSKLNLHSDAKDKIGMFRYRLGVVRRRMMRIDTFSAPVLHSAVAEEHLQLTPIDSLLGSTGVRNVLGMLAQLEEGKWFLEDEKDNIPVDLTVATLTAGLFTEGVIVVARGTNLRQLEDGKFIVEVLGHPIPERTADSRRAFQNMDFFGAAPPPNLIPHLQKVEKEGGDMFVVLSDVYLDRPEVMLALRRLFAGYNEAPPRAFIFIGNFSSRGVGHASEDSLSFRTHWDQLTDLILQHKAIAHPRDGSHFIFVPGPGDPGGAVLPRPPIPAYFTASPRERLPHVTFTTNPCRIRYCTQELLIFREDLMAKMVRHCIVRPTADTSLSHHLVKTLVDQGHLCPLPLAVRPVNWQLDYTLHLWPLPDMFILADQYEAFETDYAGCQCRTMPSFASNLEFLTYIPEDRQVQWSRVSDPNEVPPVAESAEEEPALKKKKQPKEMSDEPIDAASAAPAAAADGAWAEGPKAKAKKKSATAASAIGGVQQQLNVKITAKPKTVTVVEPPSAALRDAEAMTDVPQSEALEDT